MADFGGVVRVIDADTFDVGGSRVRLHGIDAPEQAQPCATEQGVEWACGAWVTSRAAVLYDGKRAFCTQIDTDKYGRIVARCQVGGADVGRTLVQAGLAFAYRKYSVEYVLDEKQAALADRGLHASRVQTPSQFRLTRAKGRIPPDRSCAIKGNISESGRIYHMPGQRHYERTGIRENQGEQWFCSEAQAVAAGWRRALR